MIAVLVDSQVVDRKILRTQGADLSKNIKEVGRHKTGFKNNELNFITIAFYNKNSTNHKRKPHLEHRNISHVSNGVYVL